MNSKNERKFIGFKDIVVVVLFSVLTFVVSMITAIPFAASVYLQLYAGYALSVLISGPIYILMVSKAPRIGTQVLFFAVKGLYMMIIGHMLVGVIFILGGVLCELIVFNSNYKNNLRTGAAYVVHNVIYGLGSFFPMLFFADNYKAQLIGAGYSEELVNTMINAYRSPVVLVTVVLSLTVFSSIGVYIGIKMLKKHFSPAGVA